MCLIVLLPLFQERMKTSVMKAVILFSVLVNTYTSASLERLRRADDTNPLNAIVHDLVQKVNSLEATHKAENTVNANAISDLQNRLSKCINVS